MQTTASAAGALSEACLRPLSAHSAFVLAFSALFAGMQTARESLKHMKHLSLFLAPVAALGALPAIAASAPSLDEVVVTASRGAQTPGVDTSYIQIISRDDIEASGAQSVTDALKRSASIQIVDSAGNGSAPTIGMRGFGANGSQNVLILLDGQRLNNDTDIGAVNLRNIDINNIDHIEIVNGSAGALYGAGAVGGIINLISRADSGNSADLSVSRGSYDTESYRARGSASHGGWRIALNGNKEISDGYRDNSDINSSFGQARLSYASQQFDTYIEASKSNQNNRLPGGLSASELAANRRQVRATQANNFSNIDSTRLTLGGSVAINEIWRFSLDASSRRDDFSNFIGGAFTQTRSQTTLSPKLQGSVRALGKQHKVIVGHDIENGHYTISSAFGTTRGKPTTNSSYLQLNSQLNESLSLVTGYRYGRSHSSIDNAPAVPKFKDSVGAGSVGLFWAATTETTLWARADQNYRFAAIDEHTASAPFGVPITPLKTQTGESFELGAEQRIGRHTISVQAYQLNLKNEIGFLPANDFFCCNTNLDDTRRRGITANWTGELSPALSTNLQAGVVDAQFTNGPFSGNRIPHVPKTTLRANLSYKPLEKTRIALESQYTGRQTIDGDFDSNQPRAKAVFVQNLALTQGWQDFTLSVRVNNLFNKRYNLYSVEEATAFAGPPSFAVIGSDPAYYPAAERSALVTLSYHLK